MRQIDADALCRVLNDHWLATSPSDRDTAEVAAERAAMCRGLDYAMRIAGQMPTVGGWISVKDAMPKTGYVYLITLNPPATMPQTMEAYLRHDGTWWRGSVSLMSEYVTHWMPLPTPPGGES